MKQYLHSLRIFTLLAMLTTCSIITLAQDKGQTGSFNLNFASLSQAQEIISQQDDFISQLNQLDIDARLGRTGGTLAELIEKQKASCREFTDEEKTFITNGINDIIKQLTDIKAYGALPKEDLLFVKTTMEEEFGAGGYTRGTTIYLGEEIFGMSDSIKMSVLAHELCHVMTRTNPELKEQLYKAISFKILTSGASTEDVSGDIAERWLSNPDVEKLTAYADFTINGNIQPCVMYVYLDKDYQPGSFMFQSIRIGLIALDDNLKPLMKDGKTVVYSTDEATDFLTKMGRNTDYVIDPEECVADNFAFLVNGITGKPNPEILERIQYALQQPGMPTPVNTINDVSDKNQCVGKMVKGGKIIIEKNGTEYNVAGQRM